MNHRLYERHGILRYDEAIVRTASLNLDVNLKESVL